MRPPLSSFLGEEKSLTNGHFGVTIGKILQEDMMMRRFTLVNTAAWSGLRWWRGNGLALSCVF